MPKPNTRLNSSTRTSPRNIVTNTNLIDLSGRGRVRVSSRELVSRQGRGRGSTPIGKKSSVSSQSTTSITALRGSSVSHSLDSRPSVETERDILDHELSTRSVTAVGTVSLENSTSNTIVDKQIEDKMATREESKERDERAAGSSTMDDLLSYFQEAMRNTQDEFRRELAALRDSMGPSNNRSDSATTGFNVQPTGSQANSSSYATYNVHIKLKDWKISYSGEGSVSDFLFKLDTLVERAQCPLDHLMSNFHIFLTGKAETFYWDYIRQYQRATYPMLRNALSKEFGSRESDHEILLKLSTRKQLPKESYDDYHSFIVRWNLRLTNPLTDAALIEIIKKNVLADLKVMLFIANPNDLGNLRDLARKAEKILLENKSSVNRQRQVNEIAVETTPTDSEVELDPQVEALKINRTWVADDYSKIKCWNCLKLGHSYIYCPDDKRHVFCYKCGLRGVTTVKCDVPHKGNIRRNEWVTGDARSSK